MRFNSTEDEVICRTRFLGIVKLIKFVEFVILIKLVAV